MTRERLIEELKTLSDVEWQGKKHLASHGDLMHYRLLIPFFYGYSGSQLLEQDFFPEQEGCLDRLPRTQEHLQPTEQEECLEVPQSGNRSRQ